MKNFSSSLVLLAWCISLPAISQNVGIGTTIPLYKLHVKTTGTGNNTIALFESDASSSIWLHTPTGQSKAITFRENGSTVANIGWNNGVMRIYADYSGLLPRPTITMSEGYRLGVNMGILGLPEQRLSVNGKIKLWLDDLPPTEGTMRYDTSTNTFQGYDGSAWGNFSGHWARDVNNLHFTDGSVFIGRTTNIGFERFGIRYPVTGAQLGGMHVETFGHASGKPFYGYAVDGISKVYHYYDGLSNTWRVNFNGDKLFLNSSGRFGIGVPGPEAYLHVAGGSWNVAAGEGDLKIGNSTYHLLMGVATSGGGAGDARIYAKGGTRRLILGTHTSDVLAINDEGLGGIGTINPAHKLDVTALSSAGIRVTNQYTGGSVKYGLYVTSDTEGTGDKYGIRSSATAPVGASSVMDVYGLYGLGASENTSNATLYGVRGVVTNNGTGNKYAVFAQAGTANPSPTTKSFAVYADGHSYFKHDVRIGTLDPVVGYKLLVDGKILSEEVKVQMSEDWPDYVFDKGYELMPIEQIAGYIKENQHLPGMPSAREVAESGGVELGEMNRRLLEKIEELTLHLISQQREIEQLKSRLSQVENRSK
jgi:hypothetical protein